MNHYEFLLADKQLELDKQRHQDIMELEWAKLHNSGTQHPSEADMAEVLRELAEEEDEEECQCPICRISCALEELREMHCG